MPEYVIQRRALNGEWEYYVGANNWTPHMKAAHHWAMVSYAQTVANGYAGAIVVPIF